MVTDHIVREGRRLSFSLNYANYAGIFNHRSMEKDKLSILDVCGAYGQKDIEKLDRSGPARSGVCVFSVYKGISLDIQVKVMKFCLEHSYGGNGVSDFFYLGLSFNLI